MSKIMRQIYAEARAAREAAAKPLAAPFNSMPNADASAGNIGTVARPGKRDAWVRHQTARIVQRHRQFGGRCRLDIEALLARIDQ
jgi:hypothetical protein